MCVHITRQYWRSINSLAKSIDITYLFKLNRYKKERRLATPPVIDFEKETATCRTSRPPFRPFERRMPSEKTSP